MVWYLLLLMLFSSIELPIYAQSLKRSSYGRIKTSSFQLLDDPVDVVIVSHPKDKETIELCIDGIKENCSQVRRVIVVSSEPLTEKAEWFDERQYPFSKEDVSLKIGKDNPIQAKEFFEHDHPVGWYYQQLLKLYAMFVIPDISSNVLVIDADTVFMNPVDFLNHSYGGLFCTSDEPAKQKYIDHAKRLLPSYRRIYPHVYSVCHHMLFQRAILERLFNTVEKIHGTPFWTAFCWCVDLEEGGASEYELYYNFSLSRTLQVALRKLKWTNSSIIENMSQFKSEGYHFVSFHTYMRDSLQKNIEWRKKNHQ